MADTNAHIAKANQAYNEQLTEYWYLIGDLMGGTKAMREAGERWLPKEDKEPTASYQARVLRSFLFGAFADTCRFIASKPFGQPLVVTPDDTAARIKPLLDDVDGSGASLQRFGRQCMEIGIAYGVVHALPIFPNTRVDTVDRPEEIADNPTLASLTDNLADERESRIRPYAQIVHPLNLIGWLVGYRADGRPYLRAIKIRETSEDADETSYSTSETEQIRIITTDSTMVYQATENGWEMTYEAEHSYGSVPLVSAFYGESLDPVLAVPPLVDLAYLNVEHWQSASDQRNILRFARAGTYFASGFTDDEIRKGIPVGGNAVVATTNENAQLTVVEWRGDAIEAGAKDIKAIEDRMQVLGMKPFVTGGNQTATARALDEGRNQTQVEEWLGVTEMFLRDTIRGMLKWQNQDTSLPDDFTITLDRDFYIDLRSGNDAQTLLTAAKDNLLSQETFIAEWRRRGILSDTVDAEDEMIRTEEAMMEKAKRMQEVFASDDDQNTATNDSNDLNAQNAQNARGNDAVNE
jgi:hypothetical protein